MACKFNSIMLVGQHQYSIQLIKWEADVPHALHLEDDNRGVWAMHQCSRECKIWFQTGNRHGHILRHLDCHFGIANFLSEMMTITVLISFLTVWSVWAKEILINHSDKPVGHSIKSDYWQFYRESGRFNERLSQAFFTLRWFFFFYLYSLQNDLKL